MTEFEKTESSYHLYFKYTGGETFNILKNFQRHGEFEIGGLSISGDISDAETLVTGIFEK